MPVLLNRLTVVAAGIAIAALSATGVASAAPVAGQVVKTSVVSVPRTGVRSIIRYVSSHPDQYSGIYLDRSTKQYVVAVPDGADMSSGLRAATAGLTASNEAVGITVTHEARSLAQLRRIEDEVATGFGSFGAQANGLVTQWGLNEETNTVLVGVTHLDSALVSAAERTYGDSVTLHQAQRVEFANRLDPLAGTEPLGAHTAASAQTATRLTDGQPYWAGDRVVSEVTVNGQNYINSCTTGWMSGVVQGQQTGTSYAFTAGHCFPQGNVIYQGYCNIVNSACSPVVTGEMGVVNTVQWGDGRLDWESINPAGISALGQAVYLGGVNSTTGVGEYDLVSTALNEPICTDGSYTGESCNGTIDSTEGCVTELDPETNTDINVCDQDSAGSPGPRLVQSGDSGGPVVTDDGGSDQTGIFGGVISGGNIGNGGPGTEVWFTDGGSICNFSGEC